MSLKPANERYTVTHWIAWLDDERNLSRLGNLAHDTLEVIADDQFALGDRRGQSLFRTGMEPAASLATITAMKDWLALSLPLPEPVEPRYEGDERPDVVDRPSSLQALYEEQLDEATDLYLHANEIPDLLRAIRLRLNTDFFEIVIGGPNGIGYDNGSDAPPGGFRGHPYHTAIDAAYRLLESHFFVDRGPRWIWIEPEEATRIKDCVDAVVVRLLEISHEHAAQSQRAAPEASAAAVPPEPVEQVHRLATLPGSRRTITLTVMASLVNRSKSTMEKLQQRRKNPLPVPDIQGGGGIPSEWYWTDGLKKWLEAEFNRSVPNPPEQS